MNATSIRTRVVIVAAGLTAAALTVAARLGDLQVVKTDILCTNGVIHVIDTVVLPQ